MECSLSLVEDEGKKRYIYSGEECCNYIPRLPYQWCPRIYEDGTVVEKTERPNQCCFVIYCDGKDYIFLTQSQDQKEAWVQSICQFL